MTESLNYLFYYLDKEEVNYDKKEFFFQIQSHTDYPSLLSIVDTLSFFNIDNAAIKINFNDIDLLPDRFIALLNQDQEIPQLHFVEKKANKYFVTKDKKTTEISFSTLNKKWKDVVLLIEKNKYEEKSDFKNKLFSIGFSLLFLTFTSLLIIYERSSLTKLFFIFPFFGILLSIAALKDLFGAKSELISNFCNISASTSCNSILGSDKWKIFKYINFSDLSIVFFTFQFFGLVIFIIIKDSILFLTFQKALLLLSIPIVITSLYYQKYVEKKWCPLCLMIIGLIIIELAFLFLFDLDFQTILNLKYIVLIFAIGFCTFFTWFLLKKILTEKKEMKELVMKNNRFIRNYQIFRKILISNEKISELPYSPIILGNKESKIELTLITSPFCDHCKNAHKLIEKILDKHENDIKIKVILKGDIENINEDKKYVFRTLYQTYLNKGEKVFSNAIKEWFKNKNVVDFKANFDTEIDIKKVDSTLSLQNNWCTANNFHLTPTIFINGFLYPRIYERENLEFFINEIVEDSL